jgi:hypothetical protein
LNVRPSQSKPLYRRVNTQAHGVHHLHGGDFRDERHAKVLSSSDASRLPMSGKARRGLDYTPLFRFLLSRLGQPWNAIYSEAVARLDRPDPIFWLVALRPEQRQGCVRVGEASYYSGLFVDEQGLLRAVDPTLGPSSLTPHCKCCTHTFNGVRFTREYSPR